MLGSIPSGPTLTSPSLGRFFLFESMKDICCYIIYSTKLAKFYIGACQNSLSERIIKHNSSFYDGNNFTKKADDWEIFLRIDLSDYAHALRVERKIKNMKSAKYIRNLIKYPELVEKIVNETK